MKKTKIIVPALGMLLLSTAASVTGTVAWFAVNTTVSVTGMQVKAKAEGGIAIAAYSITKTSVTTPAGDPLENEKTDFAISAPAASAFKNTATNNLGLAELLPTSTADAATWYHATSNNVNDHHAASAGSYAEVTGLTTDGCVMSGDGGGSTGTAPYSFNQYYLYNKYQVKSTTTADNFGLYIRGVTATVTGTNTAALNKSLRVAMKAGTGAVKFIAPLYTEAPAGGIVCYDGSSVTGNSALIGASFTTNNLLTASVNEVNFAGINLEIWVYYEGEDENLKTINANGVNIDQIQLDFSFATTATGV